MREVSGKNALIADRNDDRSLAEQLLEYGGQFKETSYGAFSAASRTIMKQLRKNKKGR